MQSEIIIIPAFFFMVGFTIYTWVNAWQQRHRLKLLTEFNAKVIDRLGSVNDFSAFAQTEAGAKFLDGVIADAPKTRPGERILRAAQMGIVQVALGIGLLSLSPYFTSGGHEALLVVGIIFLSLGLGFVVSAIVSHRISVALGLHPTLGKTAEAR
jgi:hypothetical protein